MRHTAGVIALVLLAACRKDTPSGSATAIAADSTATPPASIQAMVAMVTIDSATRDLKPVETTLKGKLARDPGRPGKLWRIDGKPVKLVVTELTDAGLERGESTWYFRNDSLVAATGPYASYAFKDGRLAEWTDDRGNIAERNPQSLESREQELKTLGRFWVLQFPAQ